MDDSNNEVMGLSEIFAIDVVLGDYLALMTVIFSWAAYKTD
jgi:hypothetical protein